MRWLTTSGSVLLVALFAVPVLDLLRRAGAGLEWTTLFAPDSMTAGRAGMLGALKASALAMLPIVTVAIPLGLAVAVYLEEMSRGGPAFRLIDRSIRHLAMLPPVVFGLLGFGGLVVLIGMPVGTPILAGAVLGIAMLPRVVLAGQLALREVPAAVRDAGYSMGASPLQVIAAHVLPRAAPAMLGSSVTVLARALGEAAPLLLVGFAAFAAGRPGGLSEPGIPLPVLVFRWAESPDPLFAAKAAAAALVLLLLAVALGLVGSLLDRRRSPT